MQILNKPEQISYFFIFPEPMYSSFSSCHPTLCWELKSQTPDTGQCRRSRTSSNGCFALSIFVITSSVKSSKSFKSYLNKFVSDLESQKISQCFSSDQKVSFHTHWVLLNSSIRLFRCALVLMKSSFWLLKIREFKLKWTY